MGSHWCKKWSHLCDAALAVPTEGKKVGGGGGEGG